MDSNAGTSYVPVLVYPPANHVKRKMTMTLISKTKIEKAIAQLSNSQWHQAQWLNAWLQKELRIRQVVIRKPKPQPKQPKRFKVTVAECPPP